MKRPVLDTARTPLWLAAATTLLLGACGGGGSSPTDNPPPPVAVQTIQGVAATGAAVAGATVTAKCATGGGTATTLADGSYTVTLSAGSAPPCLLEVATPAGDKLHSLVTSIDAASNTAAANITPLTELVTAEVLGAVPTTVFAGTDTAALAATMTAAITPTAVTAASDKVVAAVVAGINANNPASTLTVADLANPLGAKLTAANGSTAGNVYDKALDTLAANLGSSATTLADLVVAQAATSTTAPAPATPRAPDPAPKATLPADLAQLPAAANCASLRSTVYRMVVPRFSATLDEQTTRLKVDAKALTATDLGDGTVTNLVANGECRYLFDLGTATPSDIVVSPAGVMVGRVMAGSTGYRIAIGFPEQTHAVAELAGDWNQIGTNLASGTTEQDAVYTADQSNATVSATGTVSAITSCQPFDTCTALTGKSIAFEATTGGFNMVSTTPGEAWTNRVYAYKAGSGDLMLVRYAGNGSIGLLTKKVAAAVSTVDSVSSSWGLWSGVNGVATGPVSDSHFITKTSDTTAGSWSRASGFDGHLETLTVNAPRVGYLHRAAGSSATSSGGTASFGEFTGLGLRGMGITGLWMPTLNTTGAFFVSVGKSNQVGLAKLPTYLLGRANAKTCAALRSGTYRMLQPRMAPATSFTGTLTLNASALTWTNSNGGSGSWTPSSTEACRFTNPVNGASVPNEIVVSPAGVLVTRTNVGASYQLTVGLPEQSHSLSDIAGDMNGIGLSLNATGSGYNGFTATATVDATGQATTATWCEDEATRSVSGSACKTLTPPVSAWAADAAGGFSRANGDRLFVYTAGTGTVAMQVNADGGFQVWTPKRTLAGLGNPLNRTWSIFNDSGMVSSGALSSSTYTNTAYNASTGDLTRVANDDGHTETLVLNRPRDGFVYRATATSTTTVATATTPAGTTWNVREFTTLNMRDTLGLNVQWLPMLDFTPQLGRLMVSVTMP